MSKENLPKAFFRGNTVSREEVTKAIYNNGKEPQCPVEIERMDGCELEDRFNELYDECEICYDENGIFTVTK